LSQSQKSVGQIVLLWHTWFESCSISRKQEVEIILGFRIDKHTEWKNRSEQVFVLTEKNSASYVIKFVYCCSKTGTLKMIHIAFFHAVIKYGIIFWVKSTDNKSLSGAKESC
jgi:hypothetical protein